MADDLEPAIDAALAADAEWMRRSRPILFVSPSRDQVRAMLEAAAPLIRADTESRLADADNAIGQMLQLAWSCQMDGTRVPPESVLAVCWPWTGRPFPDSAGTSSSEEGQDGD